MQPVGQIVQVPAQESSFEVSYLKLFTLPKNARRRVKFPRLSPQDLPTETSCPKLIALAHDLDGQNMLVTHQNYLRSFQTHGFIWPKTHLVGQNTLVPTPESSL